MKVELKRKLVITAILGVSIAGMVGLTKLRPEPPKKPIVDSTALVETIELVSTDVNFEVKSQGTLRPRTETILSAEVSGRIVSISDKFIPGGVFRKDEVLMNIDPTNYQVAVEQAKALLKQRQIEFDGSQSLRSKGYRAEAELAAANASLAAAKASLVKANKDLDRTNIRLPYAGMVKSKDSDIGQYVNSGSRLGTTFAIHSAEIRLALTDQDLAFLDLPKAGEIIDNTDKAPDVTLSAIRKGKLQTWKAHIIRTEGVVDERSRVTYAVAQIEDPYRLLSNQSKMTNLNAIPMGTFVTATIKGRQYKNVIKVPRSAIRGKNELMFVDSDNHLQIRKVNILRAETEFAYIYQNSEHIQRISITSIESPINGMSVRTADDLTENEAIATAGGGKKDDANNKLTQSN